MAALNQYSEPEFVHYSQIAVAMSCPRKHHYAYEQRLEPRSFNLKMLMGTFVHAWLADLWLGGQKHSNDAFVKNSADLNPEDTETVVQLWNDARQIADRVFPELQTRFTPFLLDGKPLVEHSLLVRLGGTMIGGTPDLVAVDKRDGGIWVLDYKVRKGFMDVETEYLNLQAAFYQGLLREYGVATAGTKQIQIRSFLPKDPKVTQKGKMSRADIFTTWDHYADALLANGEDPADYIEEMKPKLEGHTFWDFDSCTVYRSEGEIIKIFSEEIAPTVKLIAEQQLNKRRCFNQRTCEMCNYRELCIEDLKGGDTTFLAKTRYKSKDEKNQGIELLDEEETV